MPSPSSQDFPFTVLVLAPFRGREKEKWKKGPIDVTLETLDKVLSEVRPSFDLPVSGNIYPPEYLTFEIERRKDFRPDGLLSCNSFLKNILDAREFVLDAPAKGLNRKEIIERIRDWPGLPPLELPKSPGNKTSKKADTIDDILNMVSIPDRKGGHRGEEKELVRQMEGLLGGILARTFSHEEFRQLEEVWGGLGFLLSRSRRVSEPRVSVRLLPVSSEALEETLDDFILEFAREIPSLIVVDIAFDTSPHSIELLRRLGEIAEALLVPTIGWISPRFLNIDSWEDLKTLPYLPHYLENAEFGKWQTLKKGDSGKWLGLTCSRFLDRYPYGPESQKGPVYFEEKAIPWRNPVWGLATLVLRSQLETGWPAHFGDWQRFHLEDLALRDPGERKQYPTEVAFSEDRMAQFVKSGIIPLISQQNRDIAFFPDETTIAGTSLAFQLVVSRIIQFLILCKESFDKGLNPSEIQRELRKAIVTFWEKTGHAPPADIHLSVTRPDSEKPPVVDFALKPSPEILPSGERIELQFYW